MFTAIEAFEMSEAGEPILLDPSAIDQVIEDHGGDVDAFYQDVKFTGLRADAALVLTWLGY